MCSVLVSVHGLKKLVIDIYIFMCSALSFGPWITERGTFMCSALVSVH